MQGKLLGRECRVCRAEAAIDKGQRSEVGGVRSESERGDVASLRIGVDCREDEQVQKTLKLDGGRVGPIIE